MDNLTHTLVGSLVGIAFSKNEHSLWARHSIIAASIVANNFPDADLLYSSILSQPFGNLLHHRGHTHTLLGALFCGFCTWLLISAIGHFRGRVFDVSQHSKLIAASVLGGILHILLDWLNTYGVHPFWPVSNSWVYGDTLFIIEPTLWITLTFALRAALNVRTGRALLLAPVAISAGLIIFSGKVPLVVVTMLLLIFFLVFFSVKKLPRNIQHRVWIGASIAIVLCFSFMGTIARAALAETNSQNSPPLISFVQPSPSNPFCWQAWEIRKTLDSVVYERKIVAPLAHVFPIDCSQLVFTLPSHVPISMDKRVSEVQQVVVPLSSIHNISSNCRWQAFLQFSRVPSVVTCPEGGECSNDLRFSTRSFKNFSVKPLRGDCPQYLPPWDPPTGSEFGGH